MAKAPNRSEFEKQAKAIRPFVGFSVRDKSIKPKSLKDKVRRYFKLIYGSEGNPGLYNPATDKPIRPRGKAFAAIRESEGQPPHKGITVVFVETVADPLNPGKLLTPRFKRKGGKIVKSTFSVTTSFYPFRVKVSRRRAIEDAFERDCRRIFAEAPDVKSWFIKCGKRQTEFPLTREKVIAQIKNMLFRYADTVADWLAGLIAVEYETTAARDAFLAERAKLRRGKSGKQARRRNRR